MTYEISSESENGDVASTIGSTFSTPQKPKRSRRVTAVDELEDDEIQEVESSRTPPPRVSTAGHSLRQHKDLTLSTRALENANKPVRKKRRISRLLLRKPKTTLGSDASIPTRTERNEIRDLIATETAAKRARFFIAKKEYFLPLLPEANQISRLIEQRNLVDGKDLVVQYEAIHAQPKG